MSGGYEQVEFEKPELLQKLLDLGLSEDVARKVIAIMNVECLQHFEKWRQNFLARQKISHV